MPVTHRSSRRDLKASTSLRHRLRPPQPESSPQQETTGTAVSPAQRHRRRQCEVRRVLAASHLWHRPRHFRPSGRLPRNAAVKIDVASSGWYRVTQPDLVAAGLPVPVDPSLLQLFVDGVEQPLRVNGACERQVRSARLGGVLRDRRGHAVHRDSHLLDRVRRLRRPAHSGGRRSEGGVVGPSSFPSSVELKPRSIFFGALMNGDKENFFGPLIMPGESTSQVIDLPDVIAPAPADAEIEVALQGVTDVDHRVGVRVNGIDVGEVIFTGRNAGVGRFAIAQALLVEGANTISLDARGGEMDYTLLDYIRVTYHRRYRARANRLTFSADAGQRVAVARLHRRRDPGLRHHR